MLWCIGKGFFITIWKETTQRLILQNNQNYNDTTAIMIWPQLGSWVYVALWSPSTARQHTRDLMSTTETQTWPIPKAPFTQGFGLPATFERPENWPGCWGSPKPRMFCLCVTTAARPLCVPWTTKRALVARQVTQRRQSGPLPWWLENCHGRRTEAQWSPQWSLNGHYWSAKKEAQFWFPTETRAYLQSHEISFVRNLFRNWAFVLKLHTVHGGDTARFQQNFKTIRLQLML